MRRWPRSRPSDLNCFSFIDEEGAAGRVGAADVSRPFGGVPVGHQGTRVGRGLARDGGVARVRGTCRRLLVDGRAPLRRSGRRGTRRADDRQRVRRAERERHEAERRDAKPVETRPHGRRVVRWQRGCRSRVDCVTIATGGDGGGSIRIPAGYTGLLGMKGTYGRIPRGPGAYFRPGTIVLGCLARSVRDAARYYDVCAGNDAYDPSSLPARGDWEDEPRYERSERPPRRRRSGPRWCDARGGCGRAVARLGQATHRRDRHGRGRSRYRAARTSRCNG